MPVQKSKLKKSVNPSIKRVIAKSTGMDEKFIEQALNIDELDLLRFYGYYLKHNLNATKAYQELKPNVAESSAQSSGSMYVSRLMRLHPELILSAYGLDADKYTKQLAKGLEATKWNDYTGEREDDHKTRLPYHDKLGRLLKIEEKKQENSVNFFQFIKSQKNDYNI